MADDAAAAGGRAPGVVPNHVDGRVVVITGAGSGFGRLTSQMFARLGAAVVASDVDGSAAADTAASIEAEGGRALAVTCDVTDRAQVFALVDAAVEAFGAVDVMVNNAGVMPLAFLAQHEQAAEAWDRCIEINLKGVLHGIIAAYDQMVEQGRGHIVNISSIYGNRGTAGSAVYSATKAAVVTLSDSLRMEAQGKIKVTVVRPTGVPGTGLGSGVIDPMATVGIVGQNVERFGESMLAYLGGALPERQADPDDVAYWTISPEELAEQIVHVVNLPWGVDVSDITVRATGEDYIS